MSVNKASFITIRARATYIAALLSSDLSFCFRIVSQYVNPDSEAVDRLNKSINRAASAAYDPLSFGSLNPRILQLAIITDTGFANYRDLSSQLRYIFLPYEDSS